MGIWISELLHVRSLDLGRATACVRMVRSSPHHRVQLHARADQAVEPGQHGLECDLASSEFGASSWINFISPCQVGLLLTCFGSVMRERELPGL